MPSKTFYIGKIKSALRPSLFDASLDVKRNVGHGKLPGISPQEVSGQLTTLIAGASHLRHCVESRLENP
jgi:hypothetical protein